MATQQSSVSTLSPVEAEVESSHQVQTFNESATLHSLQSWPSGRRGEKTKAGPVSPTLGVDSSPDGGLAAWLVVLGGSCAAFATYGLVNAWGVFQSYYERVLIPETSTSSLAWIGSIQYALILLPGLITGRLCDLGYFKQTLFISSVVVVVAGVLTAECHKFWQLLLCQGILTGFACGMIFGPVPAIVSQWFEKRRSLAFGIVTTGSALGGTIIPIAARNLIELIGFKWTMRVVALIELFVLAIANLTLRRRLRPVEKAGSFFSWQDFKNPAFSVCALAGVFNFLGLFTVLTYIDVSASAAGISPEFSFYLVSIANAGSGLGRILSGMLADKFGPLTVTAPLNLLCAIMTYIWPHATTKGPLIVIGIIYGFCSGAYVSLVPAPFIMMGDTHDAGRRTGTAFSVIAFGALAGPPVSGAIYQATGGFNDVGYYAGSCIIAGVALLYLTKYLAIGSLRGNF